VVYYIRKITVLYYHYFHYLLLLGVEQISLLARMIYFELYLPLVQDEELYSYTA
jgi:hypothetical protein